MTDVIVIGGGVIGLSIARELSSSGKETIVLEKNERAGDVTSSRNSGVIHAGIYYPKNFLKTQLCIQGNRHTQQGIFWGGSRGTRLDRQRNGATHVLAAVIHISPSIHDGFLGTTYDRDHARFVDGRSTMKRLSNTEYLNARYPRFHHPIFVKLAFDKRFYLVPAHSTKLE